MLTILLPTILRFCVKMLAEQKSKQKWSEDPRNMKWSSDKDRYGYQMLEKMGWADGKGLGREKSGCTSHVKIKKRKQNLGLGAKESHDNDWLAQQADFNNLLSALQKHGGNAELQTEEQNKKAMFEVAKASRKRVFYKRFIRSKDTSKYSQEDMGCIFGNVPSQSAPATPLNQSDDEVVSEDSLASCPTVPCDSTSGFVTYTSKQNIQEYFARRMRELRDGKGIEMGDGGKQGECPDGGGESEGKEMALGEGEGPGGIARDEVVDKQGGTEVGRAAQSGKKTRGKKRKYSENCSEMDSREMKKRKGSRIGKEQHKEIIRIPESPVEEINNKKTDNLEITKRKQHKKKGNDDLGILNNGLETIEDETLSKGNKMKTKKSKKRKTKGNHEMMGNGLEVVKESLFDEDNLAHSRGETVAKKINEKGKTNNDVLRDSNGVNAIENDLDSANVIHNPEINEGSIKLKTKKVKKTKRKKEINRLDHQEIMANGTREERQASAFKQVKKNKKRTKRKDVND